MTNAKSKTIILISLLFINLCLFIIAITPPASGYELSIYDAYPYYFFVFLIISFALSMFNILYYITKTDITRVVSIFNILAIIVILLLLPLFRGYTFYGRHDELTHIGMIKDILISGHFGSSDFYPMLHISSAITAQIGNISIAHVREFLPLSFNILYTLWVYLLITKITKNTKLSLVGFLFASIPLLSRRLINFTPSDTFFSITPFLFYLFYVYDTEYSTKIALLLFLLFVSTPLMHPEITIFLIMSLTVLFVLITMGKYTINIRKITFLVPLSTILILSIIWFSFSKVIRMFFESVFSWFTEGRGTAPIKYYTTILSRGRFSLLELLNLIMRRYGAILLYFMFAFLITLIVIKSIILKRKINSEQLFFSSIFVLTILISAASVYNYIVTNYERLFKYAIFSSTMLISIFIITNMGKIKNISKSKLFSMGIHILLSVSLILSVLSLYPSPIIDSYNPQVTGMEIKGTSWLIEVGYREIYPIDNFVVFGRFVHAIEGYDHSLKEDKIYATSLYSPERYPPDHFNYSHSYTLGDSYKKDKYLLTNELMKQFYFKLWPKYARFTKDDFRKLSNDTTVNKIYENREFEVYRIYAK